jgi:hypothetical protein
MSWFNVDKKGLAKLMEGRSKSFVLYELLQNAWDEATSRVEVTVAPVEGSRSVKITVEDDNPEGFQDITHAYTLFAESAKKTDAEKRGRFNMGEKLVLALAKRAYIETTKGTITFDEAGRSESRRKRDTGSIVSVEIPMTKAEMAELLDAAYRVIVPHSVRTFVNGQVIPVRKAIAGFECSLPTLVANEEGVLRSTTRKTLVRVYEPAAGETPMLYEMGIPVVETGDKYHVDVQQKVPLNMDRDNVTPAYLRAIRVAVLNATFNRVTKDDAATTWVKEACSDERVAPEAVKKVITERFGSNAVAYDPSDPEANKRSVADGRTVIYGGHLSKGEWENARKAGILPPAGEVTPSPKPYADGGRPLNVIPESEWTPGMHRVVKFAKDVAREILRCDVVVQIAREFGWNYNATYGDRELTFNLMRVGHTFFDNGISDEVIDLVIHEYGHHYSNDHLSREYYDALTILGAKMTRLALTKPELFVD